MEQDPAIIAARAAFEDAEHAEVPSIGQLPVPTYAYHQQHVQQQHQSPVHSPAQVVYHHVTHTQTRVPVWYASSVPAASSSMVQSDSDDHDPTSPSAQSPMTAVRYRPASSAFTNTSAAAGPNTNNARFSLSRSAISTKSQAQAVTTTTGIASAARSLNATGSRQKRARSATPVPVKRIKKDNSLAMAGRAVSADAKASTIAATKQVDLPEQKRDPASSMKVTLKVKPASPAGANPGFTFAAGNAVLVPPRTVLHIVMCSRVRYTCLVVNG